MATKKNIKKGAAGAKPAKAKAVAKRLRQPGTSTSRTVRPVNNAKGSNGK